MRAALVLLALSSPALACPTSEDMARGVLVTFDDGETELHQTIQGERTRLVWTDSGDTWTDLMEFGHYTLAYWLGDGPMDLSEATVRHYRRSLDDSARPSPGGRLDVSGRELQNGREILSFKASETWGPLRSISIGDCTYQVFGIVLKWSEDGDAPVPSSFLRLPELGISILIAWDDGDGAKAELSITSIEALP